MAYALYADTATNPATCTQQIAAGIISGIIDSRRQSPSPQLDNMGIIADAFSAQLAEMKQRSEQTDKRMFDGLAQMKAMVNEMAEEISEEQSIAEAILLLKEHGYKVIAPSK